MWQKQEMCLMLVIVMMLNSSTFCLELNGHKSESVQAGRLIIESSKPTNETKHDIFKNLHEEYVGVTNGSPSYQPESIEGSQLAKLVLRHWSPSVQCDNDSMSLRIRGTQIPKFLVETSKGGPVPLLRMPPHCGFSMKRARRDVSLVAKYNGCNVAQQGNAYVLPLRASGVVLKVVCPVGRPLTRVSCTPSAMVVNLGVAADGVKLKGCQGDFVSAVHGWGVDTVLPSCSTLNNYSFTCFHAACTSQRCPHDYLDNYNYPCYNKRTSQC
ncbi:uncharacterized protein LOC124402175 isoform X3 [Silurus meridionalis]|uniref:uncharacterized protein LOC124402175 isoform X3 n=1 Tax=Silurus meridionalis TaxID=175797 RepID=UPI001EEAAF2B|nr:uncharacterized protein LOC124402175 isoform X3 [Silurus meridionalis]